MERFVDMHCHILPGMDDGSGSLKESLAMLEIAAREGITDIITTPHYKEGRRSAGAEMIRERLKLVQEAADERKIPVLLYPGQEIYCFEGMEERLEEGRLLTLNGSNRVLVEFSPSESYTYIRNALDTLRGLDYIPIAAHVERYECIQKEWRRVEELKCLDVEIQVNAASITGGLGYSIRRLVHRLLKYRLVDYVATDAHDDGRRAPLVRKCMAQLSKRYDAGYVREITCGNALRLTEGKESGTACSGL